MDEELLAEPAEEIVDRYAYDWDPDHAGDALVGRLVMVRVEEMPWGDEYPVAYLRSRRGTLRRYAITHTELWKAWKRKRPEQGERVAIIFEGKAGAEGKERMWYEYTLHVQRPVQTRLRWEGARADPRKVSAGGEPPKPMDQVDEVLAVEEGEAVQPYWREHAQ